MPIDPNNLGGTDEQGAGGLPSDSDLPGLGDFEAIPDEAGSVAAPDAGSELDEAVDFDDSRIPPEMRSQFESLKKELSKGYKSAFTKKTQALKEREREVLARASENMHKSQLFDQVIQIPEVQAVLENIRNGSAGRAPQNQFADHDGVQPPAVDPQIRAELQAVRQQLSSQASQQEMAKFQSRFPNWENQREGMRAQLMRARQRGLVIDPELAYKAAVYDKWAASQQAKARTQVARAAATERPSGAPPVRQETAVNDVRDAIRASIQELGLRASEDFEY